MNPVIYQDDALLTADKPAGLLAVPGRGADKQDSLYTRILQQFPDALIVHRLDMATSGLIVFARGAEMQRALSRMFRERKVEKRYVALVEGEMENAEGEITLPIMADWPNRPKQKVDVAGKPSHTRYRVMSFAESVTRLELEPVTGRTHQLRVHLAAIGHPIIGDTLYDGQAAERLMLHAQSLRFAHPGSGALVEIFSETPF
ncbi:MAG: RluA family pseudouridine synthase [Gallionellaceae bacterium]|jgi:tRNA pseudouridine32 synthase/23S rRNA pseudouridine746 synthase|nr:RluA family pseudouridine synthase [Gallionellaceae bacterium]